MTPEEEAEWKAAVKRQLERWSGVLEALASLDGPEL